MDPRDLLAGMTKKSGTGSTSVIGHPPSRVIPDIIYRESISSSFRMDPCAGHRQG